MSKKYTSEVNVLLKMSKYNVNEKINHSEREFAVRPRKYVRDDAYMIRNIRAGGLEKENRRRVDVEN